MYIYIYKRLCLSLKGTQLQMGNKDGEQSDNQKGVILFANVLVN